MSAFITFEGGEGAGKSSLVQEMARRLQSGGLTVRTTREPGGTPIAEQIRGLLLHTTSDEALDNDAELLLMFAARAQHLHGVIRPALEQDEWVLCDRFTDATRAYQGYGRGRSLSWINQIATRIHGDTEPDLTLLLDISPEAGLQRALRDRQADRMEAASVAFHHRVRNGYLALAKAHPERILVIDATQSQAAVAEQAWHAIETRLLRPSA